MFAHNTREQLFFVQSPNINKVFLFLNNIKSKLNNNLKKSNQDKLFLEKVYREILGREIDQSGLDTYTKLLKSGYSQTDVLINLVKSSESIGVLKILFIGH